MGAVPLFRLLEYFRARLRLLGTFSSHIQFLNEMWGDEITYFFSVLMFLLV